MSTITCPSCKTLYLAEARSCPHCGGSPCTPDSATKPRARGSISALLFGLVLVPLVCAGAVAMLYNMAFPSAEKARKKVIGQALASCRFALVAEHERNDIDGLLLLGAPSHARIDGDNFYFTWKDEWPLADAPAVPRPATHATCLGTLSITAITRLQINGKTLP